MIKIMLILFVVFIHFCINKVENKLALALTLTILSIILFKLFISQFCYFMKFK